MMVFAPAAMANIWRIQQYDQIEGRSGAEGKSTQRQIIELINTMFGSVGGLLQGVLQ